MKKTPASQRPELSPSEWLVMRVLWDGGPMALGDIYAALADKHDWAYSTVKTLVRRLVAKSAVEYKKVGNSFLYRPAVARKMALKEAIKDFSERVLNGLLSPFVAYYAEREKLTSEDIAELERIVRRHRRKRGCTDGDRSS
ncbi:MAG: BlaI/MecI/CopY family transcriptional regulator [Planctomycetota bacterium]